MLGRPLHLSPLGGDLDSLKSGSSAHSGGSGKSRSGSHRSSPTAQQPLPPNSRNSSLSFSPASFPYSSLQQQQQQQNSPYLHKPEKMFRGRLDLPPEENADLEELEKFAKMFKQKRIKLGEKTIICLFVVFFMPIVHSSSH
jgi:hypothetical protein